MRIHIEQLTFETIVGILPKEKKTPQRIVIDATLDYRYENGYYIDYADVCRIIEERMHSGHFELLEEALNSLAETLMEYYPVIEAVHLKIVKPDILPFARVGISLKKTKNS